MQRVLRSRSGRREAFQETIGKFARLQKGCGDVLPPAPKGAKKRVAMHAAEFTRLLRAQNRMRWRAITTRYPLDLAFQADQLVEHLISRGDDLRRGRVGALGH